VAESGTVLMTAEQVTLDGTTRPDPKLCWCCGKPGVPNVGSRMWCGDCEVTWMPWARPVTERGVSLR